MAQANRVNHQAVFVLSSQAWRENSLRLTVFSENHGKLSLLARSARTSGSALRGLTVSFVPLQMSWFGKDELKTLHTAQWLGGWAQPQGQSLFSALYLNELLLKLLPPDDPHPNLFRVFHQTMQTVCQTPQHIAALRQFEYVFLRELGWLPDFLLDKNQEPVQAEKWYRVLPEMPIETVAAPKDNPPNHLVLGEVLLDLAAHNLQKHNVAAASKLMKQLVAFRLPEIASRQVLLQLNQLKQQINHRE